MYNARADLQRAADAAALAAAARLAEHTGTDPVGQARQAALEYVERNHVTGRRVTVDPQADITFGLADYDVDANRYNFAPTEVLPDAVRVRVRCTEDSSNGPLSLWFARIFGRTTASVSAEATAVMTPRDIAVVADLSSSINDDSELQNYRLTHVNLEEVWAALPPKAAAVGDGTAFTLDPLPLSALPVLPGVQGALPAQLDGPAWGYMNALGFGSDLDPASYDPAADPGLIRLAYNSAWADAALTAYLQDRGYSAAEVTAILSPGFDSGGAYKYRVAAALGLAYWNSGLSGGLWSRRGASAGNNNNAVESTELEWAQPIFQNSPAASATIWLDYIDNYVRRNNNGMTGANAAFQYRYGIKTFVNYVLERRNSNAATPELADVPCQPFQAVKDSVNFLTDLMTTLQTNDQLSLEVYAQSARHEVDLTTDFALVSSRLNDMQAGHYDGWTNMGGGLVRAIEELSSPRARGVARKVIILLTDGKANVTETGRTNDYAGGGAYAIAEAQKAAAMGWKIFTVSVGADADQALMQQIADIGHGEHLHAEGTIDQYSADLARIFARIGTRRSVELIQ
ncbi:MAG: VWA domain-containing protein [Planctomycetes bacterium]|nr:VWA domain-containing protein [Planctomycetota bacterium]